MTVVVSTRDDFSLEHFRRVAYGAESVEISQHACHMMEQSRAAFMELLESDRTQFIYGTTSGAGMAAKIQVPPAEQLAWARNFHRADSGRGFGGGYLDERVVRGIVFARLANLVSGHAKVRPVLAKRVAALLEGPMPAVPLDGQVGAGEILPMAHVLRPLDRDDLEEAEGMALVNGSPCSAALAADAALHARNRLEQAEALFALSIEAFRAPLDAYDEALDDLWGDEHDASALRSLRRHLAGADEQARRSYQAPVSYRILPRVLGQAHRSVAAVEKAAEVSLRSVTDNPVYIPPDNEHPLGRAFSTGGYHNSMAYPALNGLSAAWADLALVAERQITALNTAATSGLPVNLSPSGSAGKSTEGTYAYGWAASGYVEQARAAAVPALLPAVVNNPQNDVASPTFSSYRRERRAAECLDGVLVILALVSSQALFVDGQREPAPALSSLLALVREIVPPIDGKRPRDLSTESARLQELLGRATLTGELATVGGG